MHENIAGMRFGRLVAEKYIGKDNYGKAIWECRCDCGSLKIAKATNLKTGNVTSCGCKRKPGNRYILNREYGKGFTFDGQHFLFDIEDYDKISKLYWRKETTGYIIAYTGNKYVFMHRLLLDPADNMYVDHINGDKSDNRKSNLRICTAQQSAFNTAKRSNTISRFKGVTKRKDCNKWIAQIKVNGKRIHLGYFSSEKEAAEAYNLAAIKLFGEYARLNEINGLNEEAKND